MQKIKLIIDNDTILEYEKYYFMQHPKARKKPIENPYHPLMNQWMIMKRPMMNALKQKWKDFICWFVEKQGYSIYVVHIITFNNKYNVISKLLLYISYDSIDNCNIIVLRR